MNYTAPHTHTHAHTGYRVIDTLSLPSKSPVSSIILAYFAIANSVPEGQEQVEEVRCRRDKTQEEEVQQWEGGGTCGVEQVDIEEGEERYP